MNREIQKPRPSSLVQLSMQNNIERYPRTLKYTNWGVESANLQIMVLKARETKRYEFEAINAEQASEIVHKIVSSFY